MQFINNPTLIRDNQEEFYFNRNGERLEKDQKNEKVYAKMLVKNSVPTYYISTHQNLLYNPSSTSITREKYNEVLFKKVSKNIFDFYMMFLSTKKTIYITKAQRMFLNDN